MREALTHLNYGAVFAVAVAGFLLGWLWFGPLFGKAWMQEMKITPERMQECAKKGMAHYFIKGFLFTLLGTFGLAALLQAHGSAGWVPGALFGAFVGAFTAGVRMLNGSVWEDRSVKLQAITVGHEIALYALQGAILGVWR